MFGKVEKIDHGSLMDRVYRRQRHVYDATRKYYLLGRDQMIAGLDIPSGGSVLEIGCGTGRNLIKTMNLFPSAHLYGIDISREMLDTAQKAAERAGIADRLKLAYADAARFDPQALFGRKDFDRIFISYAVSMIPQWQAVMREAVAHLAPGGELHIVDFGDQKRLPRWFRAVLYRWLELFHVTPRNDLFVLASSIAAGTGAKAEARALYRGFAWISVIRCP
ncbi:class I SAM-dependent methyltransferase [Phyllobacterium salinisoli]|uniref:Class I SAM-dependent methyltransferase n=1 Tax=Phyllobacterium salinisoli TaxID=1899321 RepID=A0A368KA41_9HYPH|nr:class I SAM-dependent methyltransferase [Phyllobacterium salinisoli]RCS25485.1 class I SAM-dependent methyltransferase [Phyllobacterium salinisoli]